MAIVNLHEAKTHLSRLVDRAAHGEEIDRPRWQAGGPARGVPTENRDAETRPLRGSDQPDRTFDQLPPDIQAAFEGEEE